MTDDPGDSDEGLASRARLGDRVAFDALINRHKDGIYRFVRRYIGDADEAHDVLQNSFLAAWNGLARYDASRPFLPWLRTIALNKCRDYGRRQTVRRFFLHAFAQEPVTVPDMDGTQEIRLARLDAAIAGLSAYYKEPLLLTAVSGLSHKEAADMLKTTPKAIEMRLYRARRKIAQALGEG